MERRMVAIWFPWLLVEWYIKNHPEWNHQPVVATTPIRNRKVITGLNHLAECKGIYQSMLLADAKVIVPQLHCFDEPPGMQKKLLVNIAEWCIRFSPIIAIDEPFGLFIDATGCTHLWNGERNYLKNITEKLSAAGFSCRLAIADTAGAAWAICRFSNQQVVPTNQHIQALLPLPPEALRLEVETVERLRQLGLTTIESLVSIPRSSLKRRFGDHIIHQLDKAFGNEEEFLKPVYPPVTYQERLPCLEPVIHLEGLQLALKRLLSSLAKKLQQDGKGFRSIVFKVFRTDHKMLQLDIHTNYPTTNEKHLFSLFDIKLETLQTEPGIELFILEAVRVEDIKNSQETLWKHVTSGKEQDVLQLMDRLSVKFGAQNIYRFLSTEHHWPERSYKISTSLEEEATTTWSEKQRPLYLLPSPAIIEVTAPVPDYPPMLFRYKGKLHKVVKADGPERIEQEWWIEQGRHRDYYIVEDEEGCRYWLFRSGHYDAEKTYQWFLHGYFA